MALAGTIETKTSTDDLLAALRAAAGPRNVLTTERETKRYRRSFRGVTGDAVAVVRPGTLLQMWRVLEACVAHDVIVIMQASNTSLTNGATPDVEGYDRPVVIISTARLDNLQLLDGGRQVVSFPGGTLYKLEQLLKPLGREPHSVIGSSCIGASIVGGVCNNSGGSLVRRGPAYTELSLFAQVDREGRLQLINRLGIELGSTPEEILTRLQEGRYAPQDVTQATGLASDGRYGEQVRDVDAPTPARFNADPARLHDASGSAGKLAVFAVRLDTFPADAEEIVYYIGTNDPAVLTTLRRRLLGRMKNLPIAGEYMHRGMFDACHRYGKDTFMLIHYLGTDVMPKVYALKAFVDGYLDAIPFLPKRFSERIAQGLSRLWPEMLPKRMLDYRDRFAHHLMLKLAPDSVAEARAILAELFETAEGEYFLCTPDEGKRAFLHRFAAGGAVARLAIMNKRDVEGILPLDIALPRNDTEWFEDLPPELDEQIAARLYCAHFLCHVFHQEYAVKKGVDMDALKEAMLARLSSRGIEYPAEHNVGHLYQAKPAQLAFYQSLDPTNSFNPGIGKSSKLRNYGLANR
ncbi:MAG: D-lactate dehydrogenase [Devosia sp.]|uniref:D-lactate dehydrogenase n=1 Tax=Devosia sp. TaxID=1871048 RepID=UPI00261579F9|nr:D-lactate dehydrogenase [Devosia sp.]MDB5540869.1 D-lactate dehydrogenase [Devosia sp.]